MRTITSHKPASPKFDQIRHFLWQIRLFSDLPAEHVVFDLTIKIGPCRRVRPCRLFRQLKTPRPQPPLPPVPPPWSEPPHGHKGIGRRVDLSLANVTNGKPSDYDTEILWWLQRHQPRSDGSHLGDLPGRPRSQRIKSEHLHRGTPWQKSTSHKQALEMGYKEDFIADRNNRSRQHLVNHLLQIARSV